MHHRLFPVLTPVLAVALLGQSPTAETAPPRAALNLGDAMPPFSLPKPDGTVLNSSWIRGPVLVGFLSARCPEEAALDERLNAVSRTFAVSSPFIAINSVSGEGPEVMRQQIKDKKFAFNYLKDQDQAVARAYGAQRTPDFFLFYDGKLVYHGPLDAGPVKPNTPLTGLLAALKAIEGGAVPQASQVPSEGCALK